MNLVLAVTGASGAYAAKLLLAILPPSHPFFQLRMSEQEKAEILGEKGATADQIVEAIKILRMFGGRPAMVTGVEGLRDLKR